ncbi:hypothetical protein LHJ74_14615 [Streptomyces sp. N2-109]|uniref:Uncharacterized protein n=1 Tax=Streptomyces gossypii TaxID=2883101 RepID=A0ABT2JTA8_9ACTN|nr:hypothetical protein [Streptomyces gossypii]MCT2591126.1 hypothetical protein [Streptomyces gossypii]
MRTLAMLLKSRTRRTRVRTPHPGALPALPPRLPSGYVHAEVHPADRPAPVPHPAPARRPVAPRGVYSGVLTTTTARCGCTINLHRAEYTAHDTTGAPTQHGYAWICPGCRHLDRGYSARDFGKALAFATRHECIPEVSCG